MAFGNLARQSRGIRCHYLIVAIGWSTLVPGSPIRNVDQLHPDTLQIATSTARASLTGEISLRNGVGKRRASMSQRLPTRRPIPSAMSLKRAQAVEQNPLAMVIIPAPLVDRLLLTEKRHDACHLPLSSAYLPGESATGLPAHSGGRLALSHHASRPNAPTDPSN